MHIEPGLVDGSKLALSYVTAAACGLCAAKLVVGMLLLDGATALLLRAVLATSLVFCFFEVLPHHPVGVSEVHLILGATLMLLFGAAPAAVGPAGGLMIQGSFFAPSDLQQYGMNVTTLLVPLFATAALGRRIIPAQMPYVDLRYSQVLKLSLAYQGGTVLWVGFWALFGRGMGVENIASVSRFGAAYMSVVLLEPLIDLALLATAKRLHRLQRVNLLSRRLHSAA